MTPATTPKDEWEYKGHEVVWGPNGGNELHIDGEDVTGDLIGTQYSKDVIKEYINENYEDMSGPSIGDGCIDDYGWEDE